MDLSTRLDEKGVRLVKCRNNPLNDSEFLRLDLLTRPQVLDHGYTPLLGRHTLNYHLSHDSVDGTVEITQQPEILEILGNTAENK